MSVELWDWWDTRLSDDQRDRLLIHADVVLPPDLALELWRGSGRLHVVEPETWSVDANPMRWRLTREAQEFVENRRHEQTSQDP